MGIKEKVHASLDKRLERLVSETEKILGNMDAAVLPSQIILNLIDQIKESYFLGLEVSGESGRVAGYQAHRVTTRLEELKERYIPQVKKNY